MVLVFEYIVSLRNRSRMSFFDPEVYIFSWSQLMTLWLITDWVVILFNGVGAYSSTAGSCSTPFHPHSYSFLRIPVPISNPKYVIIRQPATMGSWWRTEQSCATFLFWRTSYGFSYLQPTWVEKARGWGQCQSARRYSYEHGTWLVGNTIKWARSYCGLLPHRRV